MVINNKTKLLTYQISKKLSKILDLRIIIFRVIYIRTIESLKSIISVLNCTSLKDLDFPSLLVFWKKYRYFFFLRKKKKKKGMKIEEQNLIRS